MGVGIALSAYLLARSFTLLGHRAVGSVDLCTTVFGSGCDDALTSGASRQFGVPLAGWSLVFYAVLAAFLLLRWTVGGAFEAGAGVGAVAVAAAAAAVSVALAAYLLLGPLPLCPLCLLLHSVNLFLFVSLLGAVGHRPREVLATLRVASRYVLRGESGSPTAARWNAVGSLVPALVGVISYQWLLIETDRHVHAAKEAVQPGVLQARFDRQARHEIAVSEADPRIGPLDAPVRIVVFSNFRCPGCRDVAPELARLLAHMGEKLAVIFKHYPLGARCEDEDATTSCHAAWAAEAAHRQGRFWAYHDALFAPANDLRADEATLLRVARDLGLDLERFDRDRSSEDVRAKVRRDIEEGRRLGIDATPTVYLDGRRVEHLNYDFLDRLAHHVLSAR